MKLVPFLTLLIDDALRGCFAGARWGLLFVFARSWRGLLVLGFLVVLSSYWIVRAPCRVVIDSRNGVAWGYLLMVCGVVEVDEGGL